MANIENGNLTRRTLLKAGTAMTAVPFLGIVAPSVLAQAPAKSPTKVLDFMTNADVAKAEQEGQLVFYCHENEAGTAGIMEGFRKDFPKINTSYVRAQTGALYNKILSERSAGRFDVDVIQLSDLSPAFDFQKKGGYEHYVSPESSAYKKDHLSAPNGYFFWTGVDPAGIAYNSETRHAALAAFLSPRRTVAVRAPQPAALPAGVRIVDTPVETLGVDTDRVRDADRDHLAVFHRHKAVIEIGGGHRHVLAEPEDIVLVDPGVIARLGAVLADAFEARSRILVERPALRAMVAGRSRAVERPFALASVEAAEMAARQ